MPPQKPKNGKPKAGAKPRTRAKKKKPENEVVLDYEHAAYLEKLNEKVEKSNSELAQVGAKAQQNKNLIEQLTIENEQLSAKGNAAMGRITTLKELILEYMDDVKGEYDEIEEDTIFDIDAKRGVLIIQ